MRNATLSLPGTTPATTSAFGGRGVKRERAVMRPSNFRQDAKRRRRTVSGCEASWLFRPSFAEGKQAANLWCRSITRKQQRSNDQYIDLYVSR